MTERVNLVTGALGFSGAYTVKKLLARGQRVIGAELPAALEDPRRRAILSSVGLDLDHPQLELVGCDLRDPASLAPLGQRPITHVFHTASLYDYSAPLARLEAINVGGTRHLLEALGGASLERFIHWSTCGVFGKPYTAASGARANVPFDEASSSPKNTPDDATQPEGTHLVNAYSVSKWTQEKLVWRAHREHGLPLTVVRPAPIYGPGSSYGHGGIILAIAHGLVPVIPADARNFVTTSVHVDDVSGFACYIADEEAVGEDYNVVDNSIISYHAFVHHIALLCGRRMRDLPLVRQEALRPLLIGAAHAWRWLEQRLGLPRVRVFEVQSATYISSSYWLSNRKSRAAGYDYRYPDVREGLEDTIGWMRRAGWFADRQAALLVRDEAIKPL